MILNPLQRIRVIESRKKCKAGSLGYLSSQESVGNYNGWDMCVVFTRFGKKGKPRIEPLVIRPRMIEYDNMSEANQNIVKAAGVYEGLDPFLYPDRRGVVRYKLGDTKLEPVPMTVKDLLDLSDSEFTAYLIALSLFLYKITSHTRCNAVINAPLGHVSKRTFERGGFDINVSSPERLGHYILYGMKYDVINKRNGVLNKPSFAEMYAHQISTPAKKRRLLNKARKVLSMSKNGLASYRANMERGFYEMSERIDNILALYRGKKERLAELKAATKGQLKRYTRRT